MTNVLLRRDFAAFLVIVAFLLPGQAGAQAPEVVDLVKPFLKADSNTEWHAVETLRGMQWAPLPPKELGDCLPTGDCYARRGSAVRSWPELGLRPLAEGPRHCSRSRDHDVVSTVGSGCGHPTRRTPGL